MLTAQGCWRCGGHCQRHGHHRVSCPPVSRLTASTSPWMPSARRYRCCRDGTYLGLCLVPASCFHCRWCPTQDKYLDLKYDEETVAEGKGFAKETLQVGAGHGLPSCPSTPIKQPAVAPGDTCMLHQPYRRSWVCQWTHQRRSSGSLVCDTTRNCGPLHISTACVAPCNPVSIPKQPLDATADAPGT